MYKDKLTPSAERIAHKLPVASVIIKTKRHYFEDVIESIIPIINDVNKSFFSSYIPTFFPLLNKISKFNMISAILPRDWIFGLAEAREIEKIFPNKVMSILEYPSLRSLKYPIVPQDGIFTIQSGPFKESKPITTTIYTKKIIGADKANEEGYNGSGIKVGIIDTGASKTHEMTREVITDSVMIQKRDENGHGSWCTSCICGKRGIDNRLSRRLGRSIECEGIAPNAWGIAIKALGHLVGSGSTDGIIKAIELSMNKYKVDVISMSLGGKSTEDKPEDDPYYDVFKQVSSEGIIPVIAAGNDGKDNAINTPGCLPDVLTVGAFDSIRGDIASFSSRGPTNWGDIKPDCVAPGVDIHSACVGLLDKVGDSTKNRYSPLSGTSMATPHVAGLCVLMKQAYETTLGENLTVEEIKRMLSVLGHEKNNIDGWGPITWDMFKNWMETEYSIII